MQKTGILLFILGLVLLTGCGNSNNSVNDNETNNLQATETNAEANEQEPEEPKEKTEENEAGEDDKKTPVNPSGAKEILEATADAMNNINGMALEGKSEGITEGFGMNIEESDETTGTITFDPYAQHLIGTSTDNLDGTSEMETYSANQKTYFKSEDGWMEMPFGADGMAAAMTGAYFDNFAKHSDAFGVSEEDGNYLLSFSASGDEYNEIAYGGLKEMWGKEAYESMISMFDEISGSYEFTIDKDNYLVTSVTYDMEFTITGGLTSKGHGTNTYSKFNEVDEVVVPDEVIENAEKMPDMSDLQLD